MSLERMPRVQATRGLVISGSIMAHHGGRLTKNAKRTLLVVEDNAINREILRAILESEGFNVLEAENGLEGLKLLEEHYEDTSLVLLDVYMPICDGFEFLKQKRADKRFDSVPVIVATASESRHDEITCLKLGANDFILKPYNVDIMMNRINNTVHLRESASIVNQLTWDKLTGLYSCEFFYRRVDNVFTTINDDTMFDIVCSDIVNFKSLNERYGRKNCDRLLKDLARRLCDVLPGYIAGGRISGDTFAFLIEHQRNRAWVRQLDNVSKGLMGTSLNVKFGVVECIDRSLSVSLSCDRAIIAVDGIKRTFGVDVAWYDDKIRQQQLAEQIIMESMELALEKHQFAVYFQPKHSLRLNRTCGAEALVRWIHPDLGYVHPNEFIPVFERSGFVVRLDLYVCEEVCHEIRRCQELGLPSVSISFNASQLDFDTPDFADQVAALADKYGVDRSLLHVELTETAYSDNPKRLIEALKELREHGFKVDLDDFGSGYSSLASLNMLPLDVMKIDMSIIRQASQLNDYRIVHSAIQMAQFLDLETVAEGAETLGEVEELKALGCDAIQGYYYSKPLTRDEFEKYLAT